MERLAWNLLCETVLGVLLLLTHKICISKSKHLIPSYRSLGLNASVPSFVFSGEKPTRVFSAQMDFRKYFQLNETDLGRIYTISKSYISEKLVKQHQLLKSLPLCLYESLNINYVLATCKALPLCYSPQSFSSTITMLTIINVN